MSLDRIADLLEECLRDAAVFGRTAAGAVVETDVIRKENKKWLVVAGGVGADDARCYFPDNAKKAERAQEPIRISPQGRLSLLLVIRDVNFPFHQIEEMENVTTFAPGHAIPLIQVRDGSFIRCWDIPDPDSSIGTLRWELDIPNAQSKPLENWLSMWRRHLKYNPAHSASHLHINVPAIDPDTPPGLRTEHSAHDLRLCVGVPNPLGVILSLAAWLRAIAP